MSSTGLRDPLPSTLVECMLKVLQTSALSQSGQARCLQGPSLGGLPDDRRVKRFFVAAVKFLPLLRGKGFRMILLVNM